MFGNLPSIIISLLLVIVPFMGICYISRNTVRNTQRGEVEIFSKISEMCDDISANYSEEVKFALSYYRSNEKHSRIVIYIEVKMLNSPDSFL